ncbi:hypothetical protein DL96DRAFT_1614395 [Flagelloscypha sp. PMI_526]|nr:hypothetical protein DL96DRAFT_1614395 [Flagelloscypha sp. PMI_526]
MRYSHQSGQLPMYKRSQCSIPPNSGLPAEIWRQIIGMLSVQDRIRLRHLNSSFWEAGLHAKYKLLVLGGISYVDRRVKLVKLQKRLKFYEKNAFICTRVQRIEVNSLISEYWTKPRRFYSLLRWDGGFPKTPLKMDQGFVSAVERLIPKLANVQEIRIRTSYYGYRNNEIGSYLGALMLHSSRNLRKLELCLENCEPSLSRSLAAEIDGLGLSFPALQQLTLSYHPKTSHIWKPVVCRMLESSFELRTFHIRIDPPVHDDIFVLLPFTRQYTHLSAVGFSASKHHQSTLDFMKSYGAQLRELRLDYQPDMLLFTTPLPLLQRLDIHCSNEDGYLRLIGILSELTSLQDLILSRTWGAHGTERILFGVVLPSLERLHVTDPHVDLACLYDLASSCPNLKFLTLFAYWSIICNSTHLVASDICNTPVRIPQQPAVRSFSLSLQKAKPLQEPWSLEKLYIYLEIYALPESVVHYLPQLVPSLARNPEKFYTNWWANNND